MLPPPSHARLTSLLLALAIVSSVRSQERAASPAPSLDPHTQRIFFKQLQPILINRCGRSGCHGRNPTGEFQLDVTHYGTPQWSRTSSLKNLQMVLEWIDPENPLSSPLLHAIDSGHRNLREPLFRKREQPQLERLRMAVTDVAARVQATAIPGGGPENESQQGPASPPMLPASAVDPFDPAEFNRLPR